MRKKLFTIIAILIAALLCISGCDVGTYIENNGGNRPGNTGTVPGDGTDRPDDPNKPDNPDDPDNPNKPVEKDTHYRASVYFGGEPFLPGETDITVVWRNDIDIVRVPLGEDGKADAGELDGDYRVYLEGLPSQYAYDPNDSLATADERIVSINLESIKNPVSGNGEGLYRSQGCYYLQLDGIYRATVKSSTSQVFYEYMPLASGYYSIESKVNVYDDAINPILEQYGGTSAYKWPIATIDGGGFSLNGGYTKNFHYEVRISQEEVGNCFTFAISAQSKSKEYPVTVDFKIKYEGAYSSGHSDVHVIKASEANKKANDPMRGQTFYFADTCPRTQADAAAYAAKNGGADIRGAKIFDASYFKLDKEGYYHYYNEELYASDPYGYGKGYGPYLMCAITKPLPSYDIPTDQSPSCLYNYNAVGPPFNYNYLVLDNIWIKGENKYASADYTDFIRVDYYKVCNKDGVCYVTQELKDFLQKFVENHELYTDGYAPGYYTPESYGYSANQDALWLFACGFYM